MQITFEYDNHSGDCLVYALTQTADKLEDYLNSTKWLPQTHRDKNTKDILLLREIAQQISNEIHI